MLVDRTSSESWSPVSDGRNLGLMPGQIMWDLRLAKYHWCSLYTGISALPASPHFTNYSILICHPRLLQRPLQWTMYQVYSVSPHPVN
jgi:hypothetical protein